jgi:Xaa-Pro dipeptidase
MMARPPDRVTGGVLPAAGAYPPRTMTDDLASSFREHLEIRLEGIAEDLRKTGYAALVLAAGEQYFYFRDDQPAAFRANAHFLHFCPLEGPGHILLIRPGKKPFLATLSPNDFWYEPQRIGDAFWTAGFKIAECGSRKRQISEITKRLPKGRSAVIAESAGLAETLGLAQNPPGLLTRLDWRRAIKTGYEVACIGEANRVGAEGHLAAEACFQDGGSELDIHRAFLRAVGGLEAGLPYPTIVGLNEKGAVLHYEGKRAAVRQGRSLLIDAGARVRGYASDITRTFAGTSADGRFRALIGAMEGAQQALCEEVRADRPWAELHHEAHLALSGVLRDQDIIRLSPEEAVDSGLSRVFFPHGLGHFLGIQVHDVGGHLAGPDGRRAPPPKAHPMLRSTRTLEPGHVLTVEPGVYFIDMLLDGWRSGSRARREAINWEAVDLLAPYGGVRIEDNVLVTETTPRNLTREHLP